ncbi:hypothetical protein ABZ446_18925 [Streptomyces sp. NPDC005813]|uniref:hypothetical protein n=1 Tax=Streptomyces sp. NPDC005813 TaxID=3155592 RepID=UPI003405BEED
MADEQYRWLDREAAERLLRGEPLEAVDADCRDQAERLADALGALSAGSMPHGSELPGEEAALAAFRKARTSGDGAAVQLGRRALARPGAHAADAGLVRIARPGVGRRGVRWGRPVRVGLAAALAAGMIGGVAVAAGTGVLPTPFRDDKPAPAASVTAARTPEQPLVSPSPATPGGSVTPTPDGTTNGPSGRGPASPDDRTDDGATPRTRPGSKGTEDSDRTREWWRRTRLSCRDILAGKDLDAGRRRGLEDAAGGSGRVKTYCAGLLNRLDDRTDRDEGDGKGPGRDDRGDQGDQGDQGGDGDSHHILPGDGHHSGVIGTPSPSYSALSPLLPRTSLPSSPSPTATRSALTSLLTAR